MAWADARTALATALKVSITSPDGQEIARVYRNRPRESSYEYPCVVMGPWSRELAYHPSTLQLQEITLDCELRVSEHDRDTLLDLVASYQDAIVAAMELEKTLGGDADSCHVPSFGDIQGEVGVEGNPDVAISPFTVIVRLSAGATRSA